ERTVSPAAPPGDVPAQRTAGQRRPTGAPPPLPHPFRVSTTAWLVLAVVIVACAFLFSEHTPWLRVDDRANTWLLRQFAAVRTPWLTDLAAGIKAAGGGWGVTDLAARGRSYRSHRLRLRPARRGRAAARRHHRDPRHGDGAAHGGGVPGARADRHPGHGGQVPDGRAPRGRSDRLGRVDRRRAGRRGGAGPALAWRRRWRDVRVLRPALLPQLLRSPAPGGERPGRTLRRPAAHPRGGNDRGARNGAAHHGPGRDRLPGLGRDRGPPRRARSLRLD